MSIFNRTTALSFLLFWYLTGITQLLIAISGAASFEGFKDATITSLLWLIPVLLFPNQVKKVTGGLGILLWLFALPGFGYFLIYRQELTQSLMFIIFESNKSESAEYFQNYLSINIAVGFFLFTLIPIYIWSKIRPIQITQKNSHIPSLLIVSVVFLSPATKAIQQQDITAAHKSINRHMGVAPPWQLAFGYSNYQRELKAVESNLLNFNKIPPLMHLKEDKKTLPTTVVIVIGESTTRLHMSLYGYPRNTNPKLNSIKNELTVFNNVFASRPSTIESLEQVLTFADQENPEVYKTKPSLIAMMRQAGYKTYWITNQQTLTKRNTMLTTFAKQADEQIFLNNARSQNSYSFDEKVLGPYAEKLRNADEKKLIIVHLLGTHMKYVYRYPASYDYFKDGKNLLVSLSKDKVQTINEYDNAVRYNDYVVYELIQRLKKTNSSKQQSLLVYFSDHGEDVYDSKPNDFKGRNEGAPTYPMYAVPFVVWHSSNWENADKLNDSTIVNRQYDNADFIYTFSDLLGLNYDGYLDHESIVSINFIEDTILVGDPYGKKLQILKGTAENKTSHHAARN
jgi:heptose-I-phosphate ethanolaminephosphotransferase